MAAFPLDRFREHQPSVEQVARNLIVLARAFRMTGNESMADQLTENASLLIDSIADQRAAQSEFLSAMVAEDQAAIGANLSAMLRRAED
jgi:hypothetical protein